MYTVGCAPTQEVQQKTLQILLDEADHEASRAAEARLQVANDAVAAAAARSAAAVGEVQRRLDETSTQLALSEGRAAEITAQYGAADARAVEAEAAVRSSHAAMQVLVNQCNRSLEDAAAESQEARREAEAKLEFDDEAEAVAQAVATLAALPASECPAEELAMLALDDPVDELGQPDPRAPPPPDTEGAEVPLQPKRKVCRPKWPEAWKLNLTPAEGEENERILNSAAEDLGCDTYEGFLATDAGPGPVTMDAIKKGAPIFAIDLPARAFNAHLEEKDGGYIIYNHRTRVWIAVLRVPKTPSKGQVEWAALPPPAAWKFIVSYFGEGEEGKPATSEVRMECRGADAAGPIN
eukprot:scaffold42912_cov57-Phaeocystis_antarctica.AAC.2